ncbi:MAG: hypothetical protein HN413_03710 [Chloroflexi bacterium]|jgi:hypothetical protein|nr:hypothetical protein [Chloroflexota bacterium]
MGDTNLDRPTQKAVRTQQALLFWLLPWGLIGLGLLYSRTKLAIDTNGFQVGSVILAAMGFLILAIMPARYIKELKIAKELERDGVSTSGKITDKWIKKHRGKGTTKYYFVAYQFGDDYGVAQRVDSAIYKKLKVGDVVTVRYLSSDPRRSRMDTVLI